jgi:phosphosulfolactate synthase
MEQTCYEYLGLNYHERTKKPRKRGITMVVDTGEPWHLETSLQNNAAYIDVVKFTIQHTLKPVDVLRKQIDLLRKYDIEVQPGGIIVEVARYQGRGEDCLRKLRDLGFTQVEISATTSETGRAVEEDRKITELAKKLGFTVFGEVGKKIFEGDNTRVDAETLNVKECIKQAKNLLDSGADRIYLEGHVLRRVVGESASDILKKEKTGTKQLMEIADAVGPDRLVFECSGMAPRKTRRSSHFWLIRLFGPDVNIGNARFADATTIESMRRGFYPTFGFGVAGDYAWIQSISAHGGKASEKWWQEFPVRGDADPFAG